MPEVGANETHKRGCLARSGCSKPAHSARRRQSRHAGSYTLQASFETLTLPQCCSCRSADSDGIQSEMVLRPAAHSRGTAPAAADMLGPGVAAAHWQGWRQSSTNCTKRSGAVPHMSFQGCSPCLHGHIVSQGAHLKVHRHVAERLQAQRTCVVLLRVLLEAVRMHEVPAPRQLLQHTASSVSSEIL